MHIKKGRRGEKRVEKKGAKDEAEVKKRFCIIVIELCRAGYECTNSVSGERGTQARRGAVSDKKNTNTNNNNSDDENSDSSSGHDQQQDIRTEEKNHTK